MFEARQHVVIAGAGVAGLEVALGLQALAADLVSVELVAPEREFTYRPLAVADPFRFGSVRRFPLPRLVTAAGARLREGSVVSVDAEEKTAGLADGGRVAYDQLVLAIGAAAHAAVPGAITFGGVGDRARLVDLLDSIVDGAVQKVVLTMPPGFGWPLPLYELAFLTAEHLVEHMTRGVEITVVTPEPRPLVAFGEAASDAIEDLLEIRDIALVTGGVPVSWSDGALQLADARRVAADAVVALPRLEGPRLEGVPHDANGFVATDDTGWVLGLTDVYAAGDMTQFPIKQGGIAAQQADAVATSIAADAGAEVRAAPFEPVLRGLLLTGMAPRFLRSDGAGHPAVVDTQPLWWPPAKIVGRYLSPFLAAHLGLAMDFPTPDGAVPVDRAIDTRDHASWSSV